MYSSEVIMADVFGLLLGSGLSGASIWYGYRATKVRKAYNSVNEGDEGPLNIVDGNTVTISGDVVVDEPVTTPGSDPLVESVSQPALVVWRLRRGKRSKHDKKVGSSGDWTTVVSGIDSGSFRVNTEGKEVQVDPTWLVQRHGAGQLRSLSAADLDGSGLRSKEAWKTPYVHVTSKESFKLGEKTVLSPDVHTTAENSWKTYFLELRVLPEGSQLTIHGQIDVNQGTVFIRGSDDVPMSLSEQGTKTLRSFLHNQMLKSGGYSVLLLIFAMIVFYASLKPLLP